MAVIIDGKAVSAKVRSEVAEETARLKEKGIVPGLAVIIVGNDPASRVYVNNKKKACAQAGIYSEEFALPEDTTQDELLALVDIITPNETEAEKLTGIRVENDEDAAKAAQVLHEKGIRTVLITLGSRGVWASVNGEGQRVPGFRVQAVDTIAAGDTFNGALITALLEEKPLPEAIRFAHAAAAIAVTRKGAQPSVPWREEIDAFLDRQR